MSESIFLPFETIRHVYAGSVVYPPGGRFGPRIQEDIQLVLLYTGEMNVTIDGRLLRVKPGNVVLLKPGHEEAFVFSRTEDTWHRWVAVNVHPLPEQTRQSLYALPEVVPLTEEMNRLIDLILILQQHSTVRDNANRSLGLSALHLYPTEAGRLKRQGEKHPAVYAALSWMHEHYAEEITLADLSTHSGISSEHLLRLFKQYERMTPIQYLWKYRINRSSTLLANTGLSISEIALRCGFKTSHHFARLFKHWTGATASEARRESWNGEPKI